MGPVHTYINWIDARTESLPAMYPALAAYLAPFGFALMDYDRVDESDMCLVVADNAKQAYTHDAFVLARQLGKRLVVLVTTSTPMDRVALLDQGADDCMAQPIEQRELAARLHALRRRKQERAASHPNWIRFGPWVLDTERRQLTNAQGESVTLSHSEYRLLLAFLSMPYQVFSRDQLMDEARGRGLDAFERSIDLLVSRLRHKLGDDPRHPRLIQTVRGQGYLFNAAPNAASNVVLATRANTPSIAIAVAH